MERLNFFARTWLSVDLQTPNSVKPFSSPCSLINQLLLVISIFRFAYFASADRSDDMNYILGWRLRYIEGSRFWATLMGLVSAIYLLSNLVTCLTWKHPDYEKIIRRPISETIAKDGAILAKLAFLGHVFAVSVMLCPFLFDSAFVLAMSLESNMTPQSFFYCLLWTFQYGAMGGCSITSVTTGIFLFPTCKSLLNSFSKAKVKVLWSLNTPRAPSLGNILKLFDKACNDVKFYDRYWKKVLFVNVTGYTIVIGLTVFLIVFTKLYVALKIVIAGCLVLDTIVVSYMVLSPASVNAAARGLYKRFCSMAARKQRLLGTEQRVKLGYAIKRFTNPIALSLWDTNYLEYMDYFQFVVGVISNFFLTANLMSSKS